MSDQPPEADRYRIIADLISDYAFSARIGGNGNLEFDWVTEGFSRLTGYSVEEAQSIGWRAMVAQEDLARAEVALQRLLQGESVEEDLRVIGKHGRTLWVHAAAKPVLEDGLVTQIYGAVMNISERKAVEDVLRESEAAVRAEYLGIPIPAYTWRRKHGDFVLESCNDEALRSTDGRIVEVLGMTAAELYEDMPDALADLAACAASGETIRRRRPVHTRFEKDIIGEVTYVYVGPDTVVSYVVDLTEHRRTERLLESQTDILETIAREAPLLESLDKITRLIESESSNLWCSILLLDENGRTIAHGSAPSLPSEYTDAIDGAEIGPNAGSCGTAMYTRRVVISRDIDTDPKWAAYKHLALPHGLRSCWSTPILRPDNGTVLGSFAIYYPEPRDPTDHERALVDRATHLASIAIDRYRTNQALRESQERLRELTENIREVFWIDDLDNEKLLYISPAYETIWGRDSHELREDTHAWMRYVHPDDIQTVRQRNMHRDPGEEMEYRIVRPDGDVRWIRSRVFPIRDETGEIKKLAGVAEDITDRSALEEQLLRAQRMEAVGQLAGGVAHDFNNLLGVILNYADFVIEDFADAESVHEDALQIRRAAESAAALTRQLLVFSRRDVVRPRPLDLRTVITDVEKLLRRTMGEDVILSIELAPHLPVIKADAGQLDQVLLNLAVNARDAMPRGGRLTIMAEPASGGDEVLLSVRDTGHGMTQEVLARATDPFFTTKQPGHGTGLGLSTVYGIVTQNGGRLQIRSSPAEGTDVRIHLPASDEPAAEPHIGRRGDTRSMRAATILLVEDEEALRTLTARLLERAGFMVVQAEGATEALLASELHEGSIDLVLTDVVMPHMSGIEMVKQIRRSRPDIPVLYMSGYPKEVVASHGDLDAPLIEKPFDAPMLTGAVQGVLEPVGRN